MGDDGVGGVHDRPGAAVVLLELDDGGVREVGLETEDVSDVTCRKL
jgi:Ethanolamine utilization protein EutJ (predicted chaperonin)